MMLRPVLSQFPSRLFLGFIFALTIFFFYLVIQNSDDSPSSISSSSSKHSRIEWNDREYDLVIIADRDTFSRGENHQDEWSTTFRIGKLTRSEDGTTYDIVWEEKQPIRGKYAEAGRGMELSELLRFNNKLFSFDDRTGIAYQLNLRTHTAIPKYILSDGNGSSTAKGFKCEWSTEKDGKMWVGSIGKEWITSTGDIKGYDSMWVKTIDRNGVVENINWRNQYTALRRASGTEYPGYLVHEAVNWSPHYRRWVFLPRRVSKEPYSEQEDISRGSNIALLANEDFSDIRVRRVGTITKTRGFSTFKFVPNHPTEIVALKSEESADGVFNSFITVFDLDSGRVLLDETHIDNEKFEGIEFLPPHNGWV